MQLKIHYILLAVIVSVWASLASGANRFVNNKCSNNGNGTLQSCASSAGGNGAWNTIKNALQVADCAGMTTGDILEISGDAVKDTTCENGGNCYFEDNVNVEGSCHDIVVQNRANEHVVVDGTVDIKGSTWTSRGSGVYECAVSGCSGDVGDAFAFRAWYDVGNGEEELDLIQTTTTCDSTLAVGKMRVNTTGQSICVHLSNGASPSTASYLRVPWYDPFLQAGTDGMDNVTLRKNPSGSGTFRIQRYRKRGIEADAAANPGWVLDGLEWAYMMDRCVAYADDIGVGNIQIRNNIISFCGQEGIRVSGDTGTWVIEDNIITDIQTEPVFQRCSGIGSGCRPEFTDNGTGIRLINRDGVSGTVRGNTLLRMGGGMNNRSRMINFEHSNANIVVERNYLAHASGLANTGTAIMWSGSFDGDVNDNIVVRNNLIHDVDRCFWVQYGTDYDSQAATINYILNNTCSEFKQNGLVAEFSGSAVLDGPFHVKNNVFSSRGTGPSGFILSVPSSNSTGWQTLQNNVFECDGCTTNQDIISWRGNIFERDEDCTTNVDCIDQMTTIIGATYSGQRYGNLNVDITGTDPPLTIATPSEADDAGQSLTSLVPDDYSGSPRNATYDAGAYNIGAGGEPPPAGDYPTTDILDNFNRANESPITGIWTERWFGGTAGCQVSGNVMIKTTGAGDGCYVTNPFSDSDQEVYATFPNGTSHTDTSNPMLLLCLQGGIGTSSVDGYGIRSSKVAAGTDTMSLWRITNTTMTQLGATFAQEIDNGDKIGAERVGSDLNFWYDGGSGWTELFTRTDATYDCANSNLAAYLLSSTFQVDDFGGGNIEAAAPGGEFVTFGAIQFD